MNDFYDDLSVESYVIMPNHIHIMLWVKGAGNGPSRTPVTDGPSRTPVPTVQNSVPSRFVSTLKRFCNKEYGTNIWNIAPMIILFATVRITRSICGIYTKTLYDGCMMNCTQKHRVAVKQNDKSDEEMK